MAQLAKTTARGLGWRHRQAADGLRRKHQDGTPCDWCGRPMYKDRNRNFDYKPDNPQSGTLHADHSRMSRAEALRKGIPIPLPDRLLHGTCNIQRGSGGNDHLAASTQGTPTRNNNLAIRWPW